MKCKKAEKYMVEYLYQELAPRKTVEIEKHLKTCTKCAQTLENWRTIHLGFQRTTEERQPSPYLKQKLLLAAKEELQRPATLHDRLWVLAKAASVPLAIFVVLLVLYLPWQQQNKGPEMTQVKQEEQRPVEYDSAAEKDKRDAPALTRKRMEQKPAMPQKAAAPIPPSDLQESQKKMKEQPREQTAADQDYLQREEREERPERYRSKDSVVAKNEAAGVYDEQESLAKLQSQAEPPAAPAPSAAAPVQESKVADTVSERTGTPSESFRQSQVSFARNDLKSGYMQAQQAIQQDQSKQLAGQFHESGVQYQQRREYDKAILQFRLVTSYYPEYSQFEDVLLRLAESYAEIGQFENARRVYQQLLSSPAKRQLAAEKLQELRKKEEAQEQLRSLGYVEQN